MKNFTLYDSKKLGLRVLMYRDIYTLTQGQLAEKSKVSLKTIKELETGVDRAYSLDTIENLVEFFNIELDDLIYDNLNINNGHEQKIPQAEILYDGFSTLTERELEFFIDILNDYLMLKHENTK